MTTKMWPLLFYSCFLLQRLCKIYTKSCPMWLYQWSLVSIWSFCRKDYVIVRVHLSVSSPLRGVGCKHSESPCRLNGKDTEQMYYKLLGVYSIL